MHYAILPLVQKKLLLRFRGKSFLKPFCLIGGTALALRLGHRQSVDFDFISRMPVTSELLKTLERNTALRATPLQIDEQTITVRLAGVKLSFFGKYRFGFLKKPDQTAYFKIASLEDIFAMKLLTVQQRCEMKDYVDIFYILEKSGMTLEKGILSAIKKFGGSFNGMISLKALAYFEGLSAGELETIRFLKKPPEFELLKEKLKKAVKHVRF